MRLDSRDFVESKKTLDLRFKRRSKGVREERERGERERVREEREWMREIKKERGREEDEKGKRVDEGD